MNRPTYPLAVAALLLFITARSFASEPIYFEGRDLQKTLDAAPPHATVVCDRHRLLTIDTSVVIRKPVTLQGLQAQLPAGLGSTPILVVQSHRVTITDFRLTGNADTVSQDDRAPLIEVQAGEFHIARGMFLNSSKDGVQISPAVDSDPIIGGVVRDIVGRGIVRDVVSISGTVGDRALTVRNVLVENIRGYDSSLRGVVEVSDGTDDITVRGVYAQDCVYAVDVQDHGDSRQVNRNIVLDDISARRCRHAIRTANRPFGHWNLTTTNVTAEACQEPLRISYTDDLTIRNVRVTDPLGKTTAVSVRNCSAVSIRDLTVINSKSPKTGLLVENCGGVLIDGVSLLENTASLSSGVTFSISGDETFSNLRIHNVVAKDVRTAGILLERNSPDATLTDYIISGNIATVSDQIQGSGALVTNNLPDPSDSQVPTAPPTNVRPSRTRPRGPLRRIMTAVPIGR